MVDDGVVLDHSATVFGTYIAARMVHPVIDRGGARAVLHRLVPEGRFPHPRADQKRDVVLTALPQIDGRRALGRLGGLGPGGIGGAVLV